MCNLEKSLQEETEQANGPDWCIAWGNVVPFRCVRAANAAFRHRMLRNMMKNILAKARRAAVFAAVLTACSPPFNWRDVQPDNTALALLLPCKPDTAQQTVPMGGVPTALTVMGCDAGGATFAVAVADIGTATKLVEVLGQWQNVTLAGIKAGATGSDVQRTAAKVPGAAGTPAPVLIKALGQRANGSAIHSHALYFAHGTQVFQVVMLASTITPEAEDMFFSSVKLK